MAAKHGVPTGNRSEGWRCMFGAVVAPYVQVGGWGGLLGGGSVAMVMADWRCMFGAAVRRPCRSVGWWLVV